MKELGLIPSSTAASSPVKPSAELCIFFRGRYKFWAFASIILLAFWSMFADTVTLKWSDGNLNGISDNSISDDLDVLEVEEMEKAVRHMWDMYTHSRRIRLPSFWRDAFEDAYEELASDQGEVRDATTTEISRMSMSMVDLEPPFRQTKGFEVDPLKAHLPLRAALVQLWLWIKKVEKLMLPKQSYGTALAKQMILFVETCYMCAA